MKHGRVRIGSLLMFLRRSFLRHKGKATHIELGPAPSPPNNFLPASTKYDQQLQLQQLQTSKQLPSSRTSRHLPVVQFLPRNPSWDMDGTGSLGGLRGLYQDLSGITESSIVNIDRLCIELETHLHDFRTLLEKSSKNDNSRKSVLTGEATLSTFSNSVIM